MSERTYHKWTAEDETYLRQKWKQRTKLENIARAIGCSPIAAHHRLCKLIQNGAALEYRKSRRGTIWRKSEDERLRKMVAAKLPRAHIAAMLGRSVAMVNGRARRIKVITHLVPSIA